MFHVEQILRFKYAAGSCKHVPRGTLVQSPCTRVLHCPVCARLRHGFSTGTRRDTLPGARLVKMLQPYRGEGLTSDTPNSPKPAFHRLSAFSTTANCISLSTAPV